MTKYVIVFILLSIISSCQRITVLEATYTNYNNYRVQYKREDLFFGLPSNAYIWEETFLTEEGVKSFIKSSDINLTGWEVD